LCVNLDAGAAKVGLKPKITDAAKRMNGRLYYEKQPWNLMKKLVQDCL
jgi:hypothetical protein